MKYINKIKPKTTILSKHKNQYTLQTRENKQNYIATHFKKQFNYSKNTNHRVEIYNQH